MRNARQLPPQEKDSPTRSILKSLSWRLVASGATFIISFVIFRRYTEKSYSEIFETATVITSIEMVAKLLLYYLHERMWTNIVWGKYWHRQALRKRYKSIHKKRPQKIES